MHSQTCGRFATLALVLGIGLSACGSGQTGNSAGQMNKAEDAESVSGLTAAQLRDGIGPVTRVTLAPLSTELAGKGEAIFVTKCSACHKMDSRYVGPPLRDILSRRSPEYIMNMMLNPAEMIEKHPEAKAMYAQFLTPMPNQNLTEEDARAVLEYFRRAGDTGEDETVDG